MYRVLLLIVLVGVVFIISDVSEEKIVFLDVGQGDSILLQDGTVQVLVDGGPGMKVLSELGEQMPFIDRKIEIMVLTHPQRDHMEGLLYILDRYDVGLVLLPKVASKTLMQEKWLEKIAQSGTEWRFAWAGQKIKAGEMEISILGPFDDGVTVRNVNDASVMMRVDYEDLSLLLTGDAEKRVENQLVMKTDRKLLDVDVLKAGHHGSKTSTTQRLLNVVSPGAVVISVGADNKFGHPRSEVLERLGDIPIWRTDRNGAVKFSYLNGQWFVK